MKDTKEHILDIALKLFLQRTFKEVTMQEIVTKTGLSKGAFYHYFKSKELLFKEVVDTFLTSSMNIKWDTFPQNSLKDFMEHWAKHSNDTLAEMQIEKGQIFNLNYFSLFFDALKLFPDFQVSLINHQQQELNAWTKIVGDARKNGEIKSKMTDEQIARIFTHISDGGALSILLNRSMVELGMMNYIKNLWDGFYEQIKA
jgi:TetR/AcrR family transcriptional regulator, transcriptional repressor for nem operon